jgi:threonine dehydrogenase-like Zn-dependent dehydrogenase
MKAVVLTGNREVRIDEREVTKPGPGEVLVRTRASAICRSDMSLYIGNSTIVGGESAGTGRIVPGHEPAGKNRRCRSDDLYLPERQVDPNDQTIAA